MNTSKTAIVINAIWGKLLSIFGYTAGMFSILMIFAGFSIEDGIIVSIIFFFGLCLCIFCIIKGLRVKRLIKRFKRYVDLISRQNMTSLNTIASTISKPIDYVRMDLQKMIDKNFFVNAHIDTRTSEIIIGNTNKVISNTNNQPSYVSQPIQKNLATESERVNCTGCGAVNVKLKNSISYCEYCGTPI